MDDIYISHYQPTERTRRSVLAVKANNKTIDDVYQHDSRLKPHFEGESFSGALGTVTVMVEGVCLVPVVGNDRATMSLFEQLKNLETSLHKFLLGVHGWANKAKYFKEVTGPFIVRTIENSKSEALTAKKLRKELEYVGPIETSYVRSFERLPRLIEEPILELRELGGFITAILKDGDEISLPGSGYNHLSATSTSSWHRDKECAYLINYFTYLNMILNPEPTTQTSASGPVKTDDTTDQHGSSALEDLLQAAGYNPGTNKSPSPSYSPPHSPSLSINTLLTPFSAPFATAEEPSLDKPSPMLLRPSGLYHTKRSPAPPNTPEWKIDLSSRKGHPISALHVGPQELEILTQCLNLVHSATQKGEECMRAIIELQALATEMEAEYNQWDEFCMDLEDNVSIDEREARQQTSEQFEPTKVDEAKGKGKAKDPTHHGPTTAHESTEDYFDDLRLYGRVDPHAPASAFGYRKFDPPSPSPFPAKPKESKTSFRRLAPLPEDPDEGMEVDEEAERVERARMNDDASSEAETERVGEQMEVEESMDGDEEMQDVV